MNLLVVFEKPYILHKYKIVNNTLKIIIKLKLKKLKQKKTQVLYHESNVVQNGRKIKSK